jgi:hypothetical protein
MIFMITEMKRDTILMWQGDFDESLLTSDTMPTFQELLQDDQNEVRSNFWCEREFWMQGRSDTHSINPTYL